MIVLKTDKESIENIGSKAHNLLKLEKAGFRVPQSLALTAEFIKDNRDLAFTLLQNCLSMPRGNFAVRSSSLQEDASSASFAGQYKTCLNVSMRNLTKAVIEVIDSNNNSGLNLYRKQLNKTSAAAPAVIIQPMIQADCSGIAFGAHPVTGERATFISCTKGLGDKLASGEVSGDTYKVKKGHVEIVDGVNYFQISKKQLKEIDRLVKRVGKYFGCPQDIEWALVGKKLFLLQARPITTLNKQIFDNSNIAESYPGISLPLTFSLARKAYANVYLTFLQLLKVSPEKIEQNRDIFPQMLGYIKGRIYYNMNSWYRLVSLLPGYEANKNFMEQMMGVREKFINTVNSSFVSNFKDNLNLIKCSLALLFNLIFLAKTIANFKLRLNSTLARANQNLDDKSIFEYIDIYQEVENNLLKHWDAPILNDFFTMVSFGILKKITPNGNFNHLLTGRYKTASSEPVMLLNEMAELVANDAELSKTVQSVDIASLDQFAEFNSLFVHYLEQYSDRCAGELKLESPTLIDDPSLLLKSIWALSNSTNSGSIDKTDKTNVFELPTNWLNRYVLEFVLNSAARHLSLRESMRIDRMRVFALVRKIFVSISKQLVIQGILKDQQDIFYLEIDEVVQYIFGTSTTTNLDALVELRKKEIESFKSINLRTHIETSTCIQWHEDIAEKPTILNSDFSTQQITGIGCSPGVVRGRIKIILNPNTDSLDGAEILVAQRTDPGWICHIAQAKAVLVEHGNMLSHTAVVCRELNIPSIVSVSNLCTILQSGDYVEIDGNTGAIIVLQAQEQDEKMESAA